MSEESLSRTTELADKRFETKNKNELDDNNNRSEEDGNDHDDDDNDDIPRLSEHTLKALQEFYAEAEAQEKSLDENWVNLVLCLIGKLKLDLIVAYS
jgi:hypothetical protein